MKLFVLLCLGFVAYAVYGHHVPTFSTGLTVTMTHEVVPVSRVDVTFAVVRPTGHLGSSHQDGKVVSKVARGENVRAVTCAPGVRVVDGVRETCL
jgi:hypothetical protein